jgi:uncharacterized membrane protein
MRSTMAVGLVAGLAVVAFVGAAIALAAELDRVAAGVALVGLAFLSLAVLVHVSEPRND